MVSESVEQALRKEVNTLNRTRYLLVIPLLLILLSLWLRPFSKPYYTPLEMAIAENYSLWQLMALFFSIGTLVEVIPMVLGNRLYLSRVLPLLFEGKRDSHHHRLMNLACTVVWMIPLLVWMIWAIFLAFLENPLMAILTFLARREGMIGDVYGVSGEEGFFSVLIWFICGILTILIVGQSFSLYPKVKRKVQDKLGKRIRELPQPEISWKVRLKNTIGWMLFGVLVPLYLLGTVSLLILISLVGGPIGPFSVLIGLFPSITLAIASPLAWKFYKDKHYRRAGHVAFVAAGSYILSTILTMVVFFFPPTFYQIVAYTLSVAFPAGMLFVIGFWLRAKEENNV